MAALLEISELRVELGRRPVLRGVSLALPAGGSVALVGESGSGKTTLLRTCLGLLPAGARASGRVEWSAAGADQDLLACTAAAWRRLRGAQIGWIPQEPATALDPRRSAGAHLRECLAAHGRARGMSGGELRRRVAAGLEDVGLEAARSEEYPHQWSGGMQQRLLAAMALAQGPRLLLADEPTSALDPLHQAQLLALLAGLRRERGFALLWVTHDLAVAAAVAEQVSVLQAGLVVEQGGAGELFRRPRHAYTAALVASQPRLAVGAGAGSAGEP
ncbi:MAG TPA: ATP-binding cassette domain-containing protein [Terriglobales bacterium]|nr:ATP-binding cassette domain-containing protein [Terriglobales bacterium]